MQLNLNEISSELLEKQASRIPESYRPEYLEIIQKLQNELEFRLYPGEFRHVRVVINHKGLIQKADVDKSLLENPDIEELSEIISESLVKAHKQAVKNAQKDLDSKIKQLFEEISSLKEKIIKNGTKKHRASG